MTESSTLAKRQDDPLATNNKQEQQQQQIHTKTCQISFVSVKQKPNREAFTHTHISQIHTLGGGFEEFGIAHTYTIHTKFHTRRGGESCPNDIYIYIHEGTIHTKPHRVLQYFSMKKRTNKSRT